MGLFNNKQDEAPDQEVKEEKVVPMKKSMGFAFWEVAGKSFKLKLTTANICELEQKYKTNLMNVMGNNSGMPALTTMLEVTHAAMKDWNHGVNFKDVQALFESYVEDGGSQLSFYMDVYMKIFTVSGFFSQTLAAEMTSTLENVKESL